MKPSFRRHFEVRRSLPTVSAYYRYFPGIAPPPHTQLVALISSIGYDVDPKQRDALQEALLVHLSELNMLLSETNMTLAAAAGCATNAQMLISREKAVQAI